MAVCGVPLVYVRDAIPGSVPTVRVDIPATPTGVPKEAIEERRKREECKPRDHTVRNHIIRPAVCTYRSPSRNGARTNPVSLVLAAKKSDSEESEDEGDDSDDDEDDEEKEPEPKKTTPAPAAPAALAPVQQPPAPQQYAQPPQMMYPGMAPPFGGMPYGMPGMPFGMGMPGMGRGMPLPGMMPGMPGVLCTRPLMLTTHDFYPTRPQTP